MEASQINEIASNQKSFKNTNKVLSQLGSIAVKNQSNLNKKYKKDEVIDEKLKSKVKREIEENDDIIASIKNNKISTLSAAEKEKIKSEVKAKSILNKPKLPISSNKFAHLLDKPETTLTSNTVDIPTEPDHFSLIDARSLIEKAFSKLNL